MFKDWTYRKKNRALWIAAALAFLFAWYFSISETVSAYSECNAIEERLGQANDLPVQVAALQTQLKRMEQALGFRKDTATGFQEILLKAVSGYCKEKGIVLKEFPSPVANTENGYVVETSMFTVEGDFTGVLKLVYLLEQKERLGRIASVEYKKAKNQSKKTVLLTTIYVQNVRKEK